MADPVVPTFVPSGGPSWTAFLQVLQDLVKAMTTQSLNTTSITDLTDEITTGVNASLGPTTTNTPIGWHALIDTNSTQIIAANTTTRAGLLFHNPGTVSLYICPALDNSGSALAAGGAGSYLLQPGQSLPIVGLCSSAFNAAAASGAGRPVTVFEFVR